MPSILAKLGLKKAQPKVFVKSTIDNVKKTFRPSGSRFGRKGKKNQQELVPADGSVLSTPSDFAQNDQNLSSNLTHDGIDLTNSVLINNLSALKEESMLEAQERSIIENVVAKESQRDREDSMATFIEDEEDSLMEEKAERPESPIMAIQEQSLNEVSIQITNRENSNAKPDSEEVEAPSSPEVEDVKVISEATVEIVQAPVEVKVEAKIEVAAPFVVVVEPDVVQNPNIVRCSVAKPDILDTLKRNNVASPSSTSAVGSLRAKFENGISKPPTPTLKTLLSARNNSKFSRKSESAPTEQEPEVSQVEASVPLAETMAMPAQATPVNESAVEPVAASPVPQAKETEAEILATPVTTENTPTPSVVISSKTELLVKGDESELLSAMLEIAAKPYKEQAVWFLNAYWNELFKENTQACERVWQFCGKFVELDSQGAKGCELDELRAHRVLEVLAEALTFTEMRTKFHRRAKHVSLIELLIFVFSADWMQVVIAPQGSEAAMEQMQQAEALMAKSSAALAESKDTATKATDDEKVAAETAKLALESKNEAVIGEQLATDAESRAILFEQEATRRAEEASEAFEAASRAAEESARAEAETVQRADECARAEQEARQGQEQATSAETKAVDDERKAREAESEAFRREQAARESEQSAVDAEKCLIEGTARVEAALNKVKEEEAEFQKLLEDLKEKSENTSIGIVARRTASHEREVLLAKNPDPLIRARIAEEAVVRKHEKLVKQAAGARAAATVARSDSEQSRDHAVKFRIAAENARAEATVRRGASETKTAAAAEARQISDLARESATLARQESESKRKASDEALESARQAKESASQARLLASKERETATACKLKAENDECDALAAKELASRSRQNAENAVIEAVKAFERARQFVERVRKQASSGQGGWWWASREIEESKRYVPQRMLKKLAEEQIAF